MLSLQARDTSHVAEVRREAVGRSREIGFDEQRQGKVAIVATELATNLVRHGGGGEILIGATADGQGLECVALDKGPGIADIERALQDGFSTGGTAGTGLGAVRRQADAFDIYAPERRGSAVYACVGAPASSLGVGAVCLPLPGESVSGDAWIARESGAGVTLMMVDGLGHGPNAAAAAAAALQSFERHHAQPLPAVLEKLHAALRASRGAAVAVVRVDRGTATATFCGVGNVAGTVISADGSRKMVSHNGTVGHVVRRIQAFDYPCPAPALVILHTDGLGSSWSLETYAGLAERHPTLVSAVLYRDFTRGRDDVSVATVRVDA